MLKKLLGLLGLVACGLVSVGGMNFHGSGGVIDNNIGGFTHVPIGGAGAVIGVHGSQTANVMLARTDQYNCYISVNNGQWQPLLRVDNTPIGLSSTDNSGVAAQMANGAPASNGSGACVVDSGGTNVWVESNGGVFLSVDQGATFSNTCYPVQNAYQSFSQVQNSKNMQDEIAIDPVNNSIVFMATPFSGLYGTWNKGANCFILSGVPASPLVTNSYAGGWGDAGGGGGNLIAFDPSGGTLTNVSSPACPHSATLCTRNIYATTWDSGVYKSTDAGATWALQTGTGQPMPTKFANMMAMPYGDLYVVTNGAPYGGGYLMKYSGGVWSGGPSSMIPGTMNFQAGLAYDRINGNCSTATNCHIFVTAAGGGGGGGASGSSGGTFSINGGATWWTAQNITAAGTDVPWLVNFYNTSNFGFFIGGAAFTPSGNVIAGAEGVFEITPVLSGSAITYTSRTAGIEESLSGSVSTSPTTSGFVHMPTWDINCFVRLAQPHAGFPTTANRGCYSTDGFELQHTYAVDWASANTNFFVALTDNQLGFGQAYHGYSGTSSNGGATWSPLALSPLVTYPGNGYLAGCITAASSTNFLHLGADGRSGSLPPFYTTDAGATWTPISVPNRTGTLTTNAITPLGNSTLHFASVPAYITAGMQIYNLTANGRLVSSTTVVSKTSTTVVINTPTLAQVNSGDNILFSLGGYAIYIYADSKFCVSDRVPATNPNTFYIYNWNDGISGDALIKCSSGGASCTVQSSPGMGPNQQYFGILKSVPLNAGHLFLTNGGQLPVTSANGVMMYSTNQGVNWNTVPLMKGVMAFGFGAPAAGHSYPTIVTAAVYNGVYGIWKSIDWDTTQTWQKIGTHPRNLGVTIKDIDGDKLIPDVFYYTTNSGLFCSAPSATYCNGGT